MINYAALRDLTYCLFLRTEQSNDREKSSRLFGKLSREVTTLFYYTIWEVQGRPNRPEHGEKAYKGREGLQLSPQDAHKVIYKLLSSLPVERPIDLPRGKVSYRDWLWPSIPLSVDEMARLTAHAACLDRDRPDFSSPIEWLLGIRAFHKVIPSPTGWKDALTGQEAEQAKALRMRVMVNVAKKIVYCSFRGTDWRHADDIDLNIEILSLRGGCWKAAAELARAALLWVKGIDIALGCFFIDQTISTDPFGKVLETSRFVEKTVMPWAKSREYRVVIGGHSMGGAIAHYVGYRNSLPCVAFDGLRGIQAWADRLGAESSRASLCNVVYITDNLISEPAQQMGIPRHLVLDKAEYSSAQIEDAQADWHSILSFTAPAFKDSCTSYSTLPGGLIDAMARKALEALVTSASLHIYQRKTL